MNYPEYRQHDAIGLAQLIRSRQVSADEVLQVALQRLDAVNPKLNLLALDLRDHCRAEPYPQDPHAPLAGVPFLLKDLLADWRDTPTAAGSTMLRHHRAQQDSHLAAAYRAAGLRVFGKTTLPEYGVMPYTETTAYGITRNPWHTDHTSGGSSGGAAAAVAAGVVPAAHGGDGGGSIRLPAHNCGLFGLKPTRGRASSGPLLAESWQGLVCEHVLTRSVRDSAILLDIAAQTQNHSLYTCPTPPQGGYLATLTSGGLETTPRRRIAYWLKPWLGGDTEAPVRQAIEHSLKLLQDAGHHIEEASPAFADADTLGRALFLLITSETAKIFHHAPQLIGRPMTWRDVEPTTWALIVQGRQLSAAETAWARDTLFAQQHAADTFFQQYDCLLTPVCPRTTPKVGELAPDATQLKISSLLFGRLGLSWLMKNNPLIESESIKALQYVGFTAPFNLSGNPAMSVPLYQHNGLPIGTQIAAARGREDLLLQLAAELEQRQPWAHLEPPL